MNQPIETPPAPTRRHFLAATAVAGTAWSLATPTPATAGIGAEAGEPNLLQTSLTRRHGLRFPFVGAGMGFVASPALVAAVCEAGGLGVLGNGIEPPAGTLALIQQIKQKTARRFGVDFIVDESAFGPLTVDAHLDMCIAERVPLVVFHMNPPPRTWVDRLHAAGTDVWVQAGSLAQAKAAASLGVDAVIVQGREAGGHNRSSTPLHALLGQVRSALPRLPLLAAGGIADGYDAADALLHGADAVWVGTRLVASVEAQAHAEYKRRIVVASGDDATVATTLFGPEYPKRPYRVLRNRVVKEWAGREDQVPDPPPPPAVIGQTLLFPQTLRVPYTMPKFSAIVPTPETQGDIDEMGLPAGTGASRIREVLPARQIVQRMMAEAHERLDAWQRAVPPAA